MADGAEQAVRAAAWRAVRAVMAGKRLNRLEGLFAGLAPAGAAEARRLALSALRHRGRADAVIAAFARRPPDADLRALLWLMIAARHAEGMPAHAAADGAVRLARSRRATAPAAGFVNALMRKACGPGATLWAQAGPTRLPEPLRSLLVTDWGAARVSAFEAAHEATPPIDLTPRHPDVAVPDAEPLPTGSLRWRGSGALSALAAWQAGEVWAQDAAAALPAQMLGQVAGRRVLDLCAAPGGKTLQLAAAGAEVTAVDISAARAGRIEENLVRTGLAAEVVVADALTFQAEPFDAVLIDAPCSATGTIRRHPDLPLAFDPASLPELAKLQMRLVGRARALTRPGGRLVVATCSLLAAEGEALRDRVLARYPDLAPDPAAIPAHWPGEFRVAEGAIRTRPDMWAERGGLDGFFAAAFLRRP